MNIQLNSSICPLVDFTTYDSLLSASTIEDYANDCLDKFEHVYVKQDDVDAIIMEHACNMMCDDIAPALAEYGVKEFLVGANYRPAYYIFQHDGFDFVAVMADDWKGRAVSFLNDNRNNVDLLNYIAEHWESRDGFISFMPESMEELLDGITGKSDRYTDAYLLAEYLTLASIVSGAKVDPSDFEEEVYDYICSNTDLMAAYCYIPEDWLALYNDDFGVDELYYSLQDKLGCVWRAFDKIHDKISDEDFDCEDRASKMIAWAMKNDLSVQDARDIAAGRKVFEYGLFMYA